jgi:hypothetical protein
MSQSSFREFPRPERNIARQPNPVSRVTVTEWVGRTGAQIGRTSAKSCTWPSHESTLTVRLPVFAVPDHMNGSGQPVRSAQLPSQPRIVPGGLLLGLVGMP